LDFAKNNIPKSGHFSLFGRYFSIFRKIIEIKTVIGGLFTVELNLIRN
jgi:hypothetical protein